MELKNYIKNMLDFIRHLTGACGEPHPSILTLLLGTPFAGYILYRIKKIKK
tara:strand:- start:156 stop:308 length:153 start_codon:yes stop_codon:yes gene_type:complete